MNQRPTIDGPQQRPLTDGEYCRLVSQSRVNFFCLTLALVGIGASGFASEHAFDRVVLFSGSFVGLLSGWFSLRRVTLFNKSEYASPQQHMFHLLTSLFFFYVIGYKGLWKFVELRHGLSLGVIIPGVLYVAVGFYANGAWHDLIYAALRILDSKKNDAG